MSDMKIMRPVRQFVAKDEATGEREFRYLTAIGDIKVKGKTGQWLVFRNGVLMADVEMIQEVEIIINAYVRSQL
jgi:hypothetical protein